MVMGCSFSVLFSKFFDFSAESFGFEVIFKAMNGSRKHFI